MAILRRPEFDSRKGGIQKLWTQAPEGNVASLLELYHTSPRMDAIDIKAQHIAGTPWALYDKAAWDESPDEAQPIKNHPAIELLNNPCPAYPEIDGAVLMYLTYVYKRVTGESYWWKIRAGSRVESLYIMPKSWCLQTPSVSAPYFLFMPSGVAGGQAIKAAPEDIVWFKSPNVTDPYSRGRGRSENMLDEYESDELAAKYQKNYFYNDATPPLAIHAPGAGPEEVEQLKTSWLQRVGGFLKARAPAFLTWEGAKVEKLADSAREMDFVESRKFLRDMANQHEQLPPEIAGILENSNRATIDAAFYLFTKSVLTPELSSLDATITSQLIASDYDDRIVYRHKNTVPQDEAFKLTKVNEGASRGMLTRAEWRKAMGYPVDEAKDNVYVVPFSLTEMKPGEKPAPEAAPPEATPIEPPAKTIEFSITKAAKGRFSIEQKAAIWKTFDASATAGEGPFSRAVEKIAAAQAKLFHGTFKAELGNSRDFAGAVERTCQKVLGKSADAAVKSGLAPAWLKSMKQGFELAQEVLGRGLDFSLYDPKFNAWVDQAGLMKAKEINDTTRAALREKLAAEVSEGIQSGESMSKIAARIREATDGVYDNMSKNRARVIARTETMSSVNTGEFEVYKGEGVTKKEWLATQDDRTRDEHAAADGQIVGIDEPFTVGGEALQYPGDPTGSAGEVIQCFVPDTIVSGTFVAGSKMLYSGKIRVITTRSGKRLSVTVNHPILTDAGFVKARNLKEGMNAVAYSGDVGDIAATDPNNKNGPAKICDVFNALRHEGIPTRKSSTALDFDGDGAFGKGNIEIVATSRKLALALDSVEKLEAHDNFKLASSNPQPLTISNDSSLNHLSLRSFNSNDSSVSRPNLLPDSLGVLLDFGPLKALGFGPASNWNPGFTQAGSEHGTRDAGSNGNGLETLSGKVGSDNSVPSWNNPALLSDPGLSEPLKQDLFGIPGFLGKLANASSGLIALDEIIEIRDEDFFGHVYDLQSIDGYIMCNGIVSSNCRCTVLPVLEE